MTYELKCISTAGITEAIAKAELYRSLGEPEEAESICRDILAIEPQHQLALRLLGLALTDQFTGGASDRYREAEAAFQQLNDPYERLYYAGILYERRAKAQLHAGQPSHMLLPRFEQALQSFAEAEKSPPSGKRRCHPSLESLCTPAANHNLRMGTGTHSVRSAGRTPDIDGILLFPGVAGEKQGISFGWSTKTRSF